MVEDSGIPRQLEAGGCRLGRAGLNVEVCEG